MCASLKPLTKRMIEKLRDCHEKSSQGSSNHCLEDDLKGSLAALYKRGLVDTRMQDISGKRLLCIIVTEAGAKYINAIDKK